MELSRWAIWGVVLLNLHTAARTIFDPTRVSRQLVSSTPVPDHDFDFRGCVDGQNITDHRSNLTASAREGAVCSE